MVDKLCVSQALFGARLRNFQQCAQLCREGPGGQWTIEVIEGILAEVRRRDVGWPVCPPLEPCPQTFFDLEAAEAVGEPAGFKWVWTELPIQWVGEAMQHPVFPLPVARLEPPISGHSHLINATALWHLIPSAGLVADFFRPTARFWELAALLGLGADDHLVRGNRSKAQRAAAGKAEPPDGTLASRLTFAAFMASPPLIVAAMAWMAGVPTQSREVQTAVFAILKHIARTVSVEALVQLPVSPGDDGGPAVDGSVLRQWLRRGGLGKSWSDGVRAGFLCDPDQSQIPLEHVVWLLVRHVRVQGGDHQEMVKDAVAGLSDAWAISLANVVVDEMPSVALPKTCLVPAVRKAARTEDKRMVLLSKFLKRNIAFGAAETMLLREVAYASHFRYFRDACIHAVPGAYFVAARDWHRRACLASCEISGDFVLGDCSRVASKEVMLLHVFTNGRYTVAPLKILPDSGVNSADNVAEMAAAASVGEAAAVTPAKKRCRTKLGKSQTYWQLLAYFHTLLFMLPVTSMQAVARK